MEKEIWVRTGMATSVLGLVALILVTPNLLGRPPPELAAQPLLIIGMSRNESFFIVNVGAAVQAYRYEQIRISIINWTNRAVNRTFVENDTYSYHTWVPSNVTFTVHVYLVDQLRNYFEYNVTAQAGKENPGNRTVMIFTLKDNLNLEIRKYPPAEDFRWAIPRRGTLA